MTQATELLDKVSTLDPTISIFLLGAGALVIAGFALHVTLAALRLLKKD